jgi:hypothetical protein
MNRTTLAVLAMVLIATPAVAQTRGVWMTADGKRILDERGQNKARAAGAQCDAEAAMAAAGVQQPNVVQQRVDVNVFGRRQESVADAFGDSFDAAARNSGQAAQRRQVGSAVYMGCMARRGYVYRQVPQ